MSFILLSLALISVVAALPQLNDATPTIAELSNSSIAIAAVHSSSKVKVKSSKKLRKGKLAGLIVGIIIAVIIIILIIVAFLLYRRRQKKKVSMGGNGMHATPVDGAVGHQTGDIGMQQR